MSFYLIPLAVLIAAQAVAPASAADADNGEQLARRWCASCHVVAADQRGPVGEAPPFETIARRPDFEEAKITAFLFESHQKMPNMNLTRKEAGDLASYIASLKK